jgi:hypothetical protein
MLKCVAGRAKSGNSADACEEAPKPAVDKGIAQLVKKAAKVCKERADFGVTTPEIVGEGAVQLPSETLRALLGSNLDAALASQADDPAAAKCQAAVIKDSFKCSERRIKEFNTCKKLGLKQGVIQSDVDLGACVDADPKGRIAKACDPTGGKVRKTIEKACVAKSVDLSDAFPGCGSDASATTADCVDRMTACETCRVLRDVDFFPSSCDTCF